MGAVIFLGTWVGVAVAFLFLASDWSAQGEAVVRRVRCARVVAAVLAVAAVAYALYAIARDGFPYY